MITDDIFENVVLCNKCGAKTRKNIMIKEGFKIRVLECPKCGKIIPHPVDLEEFKNFKRLREREFHVKLRMVGNSYTVSIPKEIIDFEEEMNKEVKKSLEMMNRLVRLSLEEPGKLGLFFKMDIGNKKSLKKEKKEQIEEEQLEEE
jgi:uncharacterized Zn finger protein